MFAYLSSIPTLLTLKCQATSISDFLSLDNLANCLKVKSAYHIMQVQKAIKDAKVHPNVWMNELIATDLEAMIRAHLMTLMFESSVKVISNHKFKDPNLPPVLLAIVQLFAAKHLKDSATALYETGFFSKGAATLLDQANKHLLVVLRPHMLGLVEWFSVGDSIPSVIGNKFGDIYEAQLNAAVTSRLNKNKVPSYYEKYMKPTMTMYSPSDKL